jgi:hypothetical protein
MQGTSARQLATIEKILAAVNAQAPEHGHLEFVETVPFGASLAIERSYCARTRARRWCRSTPGSASALATSTKVRRGSPTCSST